MAIPSPAYQSTVPGISYQFEPIPAPGTFIAFLGSLVAASLPAAAAGNLGTHAVVTDATANTWGSTVAGGGSDVVLVWSNGSAWTIVGK